MAVTLKTGLTLSTLIKSLWTVDQGDSNIMNLVVELEAAGYSLKVSPSNITIVYTDSNDEVYGATQCEVKADTLALVVQGKVGYAVKVALRHKVTTMIYSAHQWHQQHGTNKPMMDEITDDELKMFKSEVLKDYFGSSGIYHHKVTAIKKLRDLVQISLKDAKHLVEKWVDESLSIVSSTMDGKTLGEILEEHVEEAAADPVSLAQENPEYKSLKSHIMDLSEAKHLHQAVYGTSTGSRYYVIALGDDARVAVRIRSETDISINISIKAICTKAPQSAAGQKVTAGFERAALAKAKGGHWSLHLNPTSMVMAERSIGSTLFAMGIPFWAVTGQLSVLAGK